jgi:hypothetical protein
MFIKIFFPESNEDSWLHHKAKLRALEEFPPVCHEVHKEMLLQEHFHSVTNAKFS